MASSSPSLLPPSPHPAAGRAREAAARPAPLQGFAGQARRPRGLRHFLVLAVAMALAGVVGAVPPPGVRGAGPVPGRPAAVDVEPSVGQPGAVPRIVFHGSRTKRVVALTFDDGYAPDRIRSIFRTLQREHVAATFFVTGVYVQRDPALWREIAAAGFPMANHSYLHRDTRSLTTRQEETDLAHTQRAVEQVTGRPMLPLYRPPYGAHDATTDALASEAGFPYIVLWDVTGGDSARNPTVATVVRNATAGRPGSIVLLHAGPAVTPRALPAIIAWYRARGYGFVTLAEMLGLPVNARATGPGASTALAGLPPVAGVAPAAPAGDDTGVPPSPSARPTPTADAPGSGSAGVPVVGPPAGAPAVDPPASVTPVLIASPAANPAPATGTAAARATAWARSDGTPVALAAWTAAALLALLLVAAAAGRRTPAHEGPPPG